MRFAISALLVASCSIVAAPAETDDVSVEFESSGTYIFVPVRNGAGPLWCILDTGARSTQINSRRASAQGIKLNGSLEIGAAKLENLKIEKPSFGEIEGEFGRRIDGIIGYDVFRRFVVEIDYAAHRVSLHNPLTYHYAGPEQPIPIRVKDGFAYVRAQLQGNGGKSADGDFQLDTGEDGALELNHPFVQENQLLAIAGPTLPSKGWGADGTSDERDGRLESFKIGRFTLDDPVVFFALTTKGELGRSDYAGLRGGKILKRFKVILDYTHEWIVLEPNQQLREPFESDMSGIVLEVKGRDFSTYRVTRILDGSPASEAGLVKGDLLISVEGSRRLRWDSWKSIVSLSRKAANFRLRSSEKDSF